MDYIGEQIAYTYGDHGRSLAYVSHVLYSFDEYLQGSGVYGHVLSEWERTWDMVRYRYRHTLADLRALIIPKQPKTLAQGILWLKPGGHIWA